MDARHVPPEINQEAPGGILFVGRDPGSTENVVGRPFVGEAGDVLDTTLALAGLRRQDVNLHNRVPWRPEDNDFARHNLWQVQQGLTELLSLIDQLQPSLIVAMGNEACFDLVPGWPGGTIFKASGIMDRRGYFWQNPRLPCPVMSTIHPANVIYKIMPNRMLLEIDMLRVRAFSRGELPLTYPPYPSIASHPKDLLCLYDNDVVAFDIETTMGGTRLLCIAFYGSSMERPVVVMWQNFDWCRSFLQSEVPKVAHNGAFDTYFLKYRKDCHVEAFQHDTSVLHWAMYPELAGKEETGGEIRGGLTRKSLAFLASQHLNVPWWKEYTGDKLRMAELCGTDVWVTRKLFDIMLPEAESMHVMDQYRQAMQMVPTLNKIEARGILVDDSLRRDRLRRLQKRHEALVQESREAALDYIKSEALETFRQEQQCKCCGGGKVARERCWRCAGFKKKPGKKELVEMVAGLASVDPMTYRDMVLMKKAELEKALLSECQECSGAGSLVTYDFNPMSGPQMIKLLWHHLKVPKGRDGPGADEETLKRVLEWCTEET